MQMAQDEDAEVRKLHSRLRSMPELEKYFTFENGLLYRKPKHGQLNKNLRLVVPKSMVTTILAHHHGVPLTGHLGRHRTQLMISSRYYWPGMAKDVGRWVKGCLLCARRKTPRPLRHGPLQSIMATRPLETVAIDIVGKLPETIDGNQYLLTMIDHFTRWPIAIPIPNRSIPVVAKSLYKYLICQYGVPKRILSDREKTFVSAAIKTLCK
jgi:hypothetical protein